MGVHNNNPGDWKLRTTVVSGKKARRDSRGAAVAAVLPPEFLREGVVIDEVLEAESAAPALSRGGLLPLLDFSVDCESGEKAVVVVRHSSGALTVHSAVEENAPVQDVMRRGGIPGMARFRIAHRSATVEAEPTRGFISRLLKIIVIKVNKLVLNKLIAAGVRLIAPAVERLWWKARGLEEGWSHVDAAGLRSGRLKPAEMKALFPGGRSLLFLHGTFSHAASSFRDLAQSDGSFLSAVDQLYAGRVFAFDHFTLSRSPEENARMLLEGLPERECVFDVVAHSRGGLLLRTLEEQRARLGPSASRFKLGHAVLVGTPNTGTPLATPNRWEQTIGLLANLLEKFPDNPWTLAAEVVADGLVAIAGHAVLDLPGLASMNSDGESIAMLQGPPGPSPDSYSALTANYHPDDATLQRWVDAGVDLFFNGANDLVVPSEGSWLVDDSSCALIPPERVGCFGPGGNMPVVGRTNVHHLNYFAQRESAVFILNALRRRPQDKPILSLDATLPSRRMRRGLPTSRPVPLPQPSAASSAYSESSRAVAIRDCRARSEEFHLLILGSRDDSKGIQILATYGGARVLEPFETRNPELAQKEKKVIQEGKLRLELPGTRFHSILRIHNNIKRCLAGDPKAMPKEDELKQFGQNLFDALMRGNIRRLYDVARSEHRERMLNVIFTSSIAWLADIPWEFAFDPSRRKFLASEEVHFIRNVITAVPAQRIERKCGALSILVVSAQPLGLAGLGVDDEMEKLRDDFRALTDAGLARIDVLPRATPATLHDRLLTGTFDIVHFIGHGHYDERASEGFLAFESAEGGIQYADVRTLRELLCFRGIQLIFLNACESGRDDQRVENRGVAQALVEGGLPAVVANQYKVLDPSAIAFAERFYWSLTQGTTLGEAAREARISLNYSIQGEAIDWAIPVVFARDPNYRLCEVREGMIPIPYKFRDRSFVHIPWVEAQGVRGHGLTRRKETDPAKQDVIRVALVDLDRTFPDLESWLADLNAVQRRFLFSLQQVVIPLGSWFLNDRQQYLHAEAFAERIKGIPSELGVDLLACLTSWPMMEEETGIVDIYDWWGDRDKTPVTIFSTANLAIPARGLETNRILTNTLVENLTAYYSGAKTHHRRPRNCPLYYNEERDIDLMRGRMAFDKKCRATLSVSIPDKLPALEALLGVFHSS